MKAFVIFEDELHANFYPLSLTRPLWDLRCGAFSFRERWEHLIRARFGKNSHIFFFTREHLVPWYRSRYPDCEVNNHGVFYQFSEIQFINATSYHLTSSLECKKESVLYLQNQPVTARISSKKLNRSMESVPAMIRNSSVRAFEPHGDDETAHLGKASYIWDLVSLNGRLLSADFSFFGASGERKVPDTVTILGDRDQIYLGEGVEMEPFSVLDARKGPIMIDDGALICAFSRIEGPCYIGKNARILGAKIREGCSIGEKCRIGGEVEESIFHGNTNKYHDGFIGHSYIGEWVNMGAMTTNSDLKNNYRDVKVYIPEVRKSTKSNKMGCFIGDHVKTSIGTLINTGCSVGTGAMLVNSGSLTPYHIPPFAWYIHGNIEERTWLDDFIATAGLMMSRRDVAIGDEYASMLRELYHHYVKPVSGK